jgi:hypothetical protein
MREEMLLLGQVPLAVGDPVTAALTVPPLSLGRIGCPTYFGHPVTVL